jgi:MFS family permease
MGQGVIWYTGQFYAQNFLETKAMLNFEQSRTIILWAILFGTPFFVVFGALSDKIGRKWIMMTGMLLGVLTYRPIYQVFLDKTDVVTHTLQAKDVGEKVVRYEPLGTTTDSVAITSIYKQLPGGLIFKQTTTDTLYANNMNIAGSGAVLYTEKTLAGSDYWLFVFLVFIQVIYVTMVYGPIAAFLVELFPTRIRYTSMSLPYHIGNGVFGGLVPFIATLITSFKGATPLSGLWYPIGVAAVCFIIGSIYLTNNVDKTVDD